MSKMKIFYVDPKKLAIDPDNPRQSMASAEKDATLLASIKAHGLQQPLIVRPAAPEDGQKPPKGVEWYVMDGGRRFTQAIKAKLEEVPCRLNDSGYGAAELGTAINTSAAPMHPLDEAAAIAEAIAKGDEGSRQQAIATRFGRSEAWVAQRLALDGLHPSVKKLFRDGVISLQGAQMFTLGSHKAQAEYAKKAAKGPEWLLEASAIKRAMTDEKIPASMALFDLKDYPADKIETDLFSHGAGDDGDDSKEGVYLLDREKFDELQEKHIAETTALLEEEGWNVVRLAPDEINGFSGKYVRVEGRIKKSERSKYVAVVAYDPRNGILAIRRGYVARSKMGKAKVGKTASGEEAVDAAEVQLSGMTDLSESQKNMLAALQADAMQKELGHMNIMLAGYTVISAIFSWNRHMNVLVHGPNWVGANVAFDEGSKVGQWEVTRHPPMTFEQYSNMDAQKMNEVWCDAASHLLHIPPEPEPVTSLNGGYVPPQWYRPERGFFNRYRLDALQDYARTVGVDPEGKKKKELVELLLKHDDHRVAYAKLFPKDKVKPSLAEAA